jgi:hypothetical protein
VPSDSPEREAWLACKACAGFVAECRARIEVAGAHAHAFINPVGSIFRVGCFDEAPGALPEGEESLHWTWFPGFAWRMATCRGCGDHLGWAYRNGGAQFVALILDRLVELGSAEPPPAPN